MAVDIYSRGSAGSVTVPSSSEPRANFYTNGRAADAPVGIQNAWGPPAASPDYWLQFDQVEAMATARPAPTLGEVAIEVRRQADWLYRLPPRPRHNNLAALRLQDPSRYALVCELLISMAEPMSDDYVRPPVDVTVPSNPTPVAEPFEITGIDWASPPRSQPPELPPFYGTASEALSRTWPPLQEWSAPPASATPQPFTAKPRTPAVKEPTVCATPTGRRPAPRHRGPKSQP